MDGEERRGEEETEKECMGRHKVRICVLPE